MALEASNSEVKRIVGEALGETFGERDAATAAARSLAEAFRALRARRASTRGGHDRRETTRRDDTWVEDDRELDAETEAALEEALETVRKWKSEAERERAARRDAEAALSEAREELDTSRRTVSSLRAAKEEADQYETDMADIVESLENRIKQLGESATTNGDAAG